MSRYPPETILITNVHSSLNAGDLALLECTMEQLSANFPTVKFNILANWPKEPYYSNLSQWKTNGSPAAICGTMQGKPLLVQFFNLIIGCISACLYAGFHRSWLIPPAWWALFTTYEEADLVVGVSGNQFYSTGRWGWPFPVNAFSIALAHLLKRPFFTMPQTIGPLKREWEKRILGFLYRRAKLVLVRDAASLSFAAEIGIPADRFQYMPDPAFSFPAANRAEAYAILEKYGYSGNVPAVGVTILASIGKAMDAGVIDNYYQTMATLLSEITSRLHARVLYFLPGCGSNLV